MTAPCHDSSTGIARSIRQTARGGHGGIGYKWIEEAEFKATLRGGLGVSKEWGSEDQDIRPEALVGISIDWSISDKQSIDFVSTIFPDLEETGEFRLVTTANWSLMMDEQANMSLTAGVFHEYQSDVDPGIDKSDVKIFAGLQFDF